MKCKLCEESAARADFRRVCAFESPEREFVGSNWNCATLSALRAHMRVGDPVAVALTRFNSDDPPLSEVNAKIPRGKFYYRDDDGAGTIGVLLVPEGILPDDAGDFWLVATWHKDRGAVERCFTFGRGFPHPVTEDEAVEALRILEARENG